MLSSSPSPNGFESESNERASDDGRRPLQHPEVLRSRTSEHSGGLKRDRTSNRAPMPFVWQYGTQLILLDDEPGGWVMAELRFDAELCRYVEVRRAVYEQTREAIGAVLSRSLSSGDHAAVDMALCLHVWMFTYFGVSVVSDVLARPDAKSVEFTI